MALLDFQVITIITVTILVSVLNRFLWNSHGWCEFTYRWTLFFFLEKIGPIEPLIWGKMCPQNWFFDFHSAGIGFLREKSQSHNRYPISRRKSYIHFFPTPHSLKNDHDPHTFFRGCLYPNTEFAVARCTLQIMLLLQALEFFRSSRSNRLYFQSSTFSRLIRSGSNFLIANIFCRSWVTTFFIPVHVWRGRRVNLCHTDPLKCPSTVLALHSIASCLFSAKLYRLCGAAPSGIWLVRFIDSHSWGVVHAHCRARQVQLRSPFVIARPITGYCIPFPRGVLINLQRSSPIHSSRICSVIAVNQSHQSALCHPSMSGLFCVQVRPSLNASVSGVKICTTTKFLASEFLASSTSTVAASESLRRTRRRYDLLASYHSRIRSFAPSRRCCRITSFSVKAMYVRPGLSSIQSQFRR